MASFESFDGLSLFYQDEGDGRTVVLLHGFAADTNVNYVRSGIFDLLLDEGYRVVTLDARGHGLSSKPTDSAAYADDCSTTSGSTTCCSSAIRWARTSRCGWRPTSPA